MFRKLAAIAVVSLIAGSAFAQQTLDTAQDMLRSAGVAFEIPATATQEQIDRLIAILNDQSLSDEDRLAQVKEIFGMN